MSFINRRVKKGAAFLDKKGPGWHKVIDTGRLDMNSPLYCVLGQVYDEFFYGIVKLELSYRDTVKYGFELNWWQRRNLSAKLHNGEKLKEAWLNEISSRQF